MAFMRIILPLIIVGAFLYAPLLEQSSVSSFTGEGTTMVTGEAYVGQSVDCALGLQFNPMAEGCGPAGGTTGWIAYAAVALSLIAAIIGVLGLLPFLAKIASFFTTLSGLSATVLSGYLLFQIWQQDAFGDVQYGMWVVAGVSVLTLLVGLSSMSASSD